MNWNETLRVIPNGVQTLSKMPSKHVDGVYPKYIEKGQGGYIYDHDGNKYVDYPCGLGAILLGHNYKTVTQAVADQMLKGQLFPIPSQLETELARKLTEIVPCAEMVRFLKTGSEATQAAIRLARAYTGKEKVMACGYHGWHDWYNASTDKNKGTVSALKKTITQFKYNDYDDFKSQFFGKGGKVDIAAVIMEPYMLSEPENDFLKKIRKDTEDNGVVLIFDEVVTGFRTLKYSAQAYFNVTPDLSCFGKALGNGFPISFVCGKKEIMQELEGDCFVSSTFGGELTSIAAALAVLDTLEKTNGIQHIWTIGSRLIEDFNRYSYAYENTECIGYPCRTFFKFPTGDHKSLFWQECLRHGVFFGYAQFICLSHDIEHLDITSMAIRESFKVLKKYWDKPLDALNGKPAQETFRLVADKVAR